MSCPSGFGYYSVPSLVETIFAATGARAPFWAALFATASLVSLASINPIPMGVAVGVLAFGMLGGALA